MKKFLLLFFLTFTMMHAAFAQSPCTGNVPIAGLANGMDYTITVGAGGDVEVMVTVVDNPAGLVGFLGGPGGIFQVADATGSFSYSLTGQSDPYVLDMFFNWAAGGAGSSETVSCAAAPAGPEVCTGNVPITGLANGMDYTITVEAGGDVEIMVTVVDNPAGLVGFLGGPGGIFQVADATGSFSYSLTGQTSPYVLDMFFNWAAGGAGSSETVSCPDGGGPSALEIPLDFDDPTLTYNLAPFGANMSAVLGADPTDPNNQVVCMTKTAGADCWSGVTIGGPAPDFCLDNPIPFAPGNMTFYVDVYSPVAGAPFVLKVENCANSTISSEVLALTTIANGWETLIFDFSTGCAAPPDLNNTYSKVIVFPQFTCNPDACGNTNPGANAPFTTESYYVDNISMTPPPLGPPALPITFGDPFTDYELAPFGANVTAVIGADPTDPANEVLCVTKNPAPDCWGGVTVGASCLDAPIDFSTGSAITVDVYSPVAGAPMLLKVEDCTNGAIASEVLVLTTVSNAWETLTFDFAASGCPAGPNTANTYDKISIFPQFTCTPDACGDANPGSGAPSSTLPYYFDNFEFVIAPPPPSPDLPLITFDDPGVDYNLSDFGGVISTFGEDPTDPSNQVVCATKPAGADCWGGTTVGGPAGCLENPIPFTATDQILTVDVYSPNVGTPFLLKVEDCTNGAIASEVLVLTTVANQWETLVFDFLEGCAPINLANTYDRVSVFSEFSCAASACGPIPPESNTPMNGTVYYFDNIAFGLPYDVDIADPCVCLDNASVIDLDAGTGGDDGTFGEIVSITGPGGAALPAGLVFEVTAITGGAGGTIAVGDLLIFNAATGHYEINFEHTDAIGYTITVDQIAPGVPTPALTISNVCAYPNPTFDPALAAQYCAVDAVVTLGGTDALGSDAVSFTIDGAPATEIDPGALSLGTHLVVMTWDGAAGTNDGSGTVAAPNEPGCIQTVQQTIEVINEAPAITCPADVVLDCTESLPDGVTTEAEFVALGGTTAGNCTITDVAFEDEVTVTGCGVEIVRTYTLGSGTATSSCVQMLRTVDSTPPVVVCPPALTLSCFETPPAPATTAAEFIAAGGVIADDCTSDLSDFTVFAQNNDNGGDNCPGNARVVTRTYYIQDACGNTTTCEQVLTYTASAAGSGPVITSILPSCFKYCSSLANPMESDVTFTTDCSFDATVNITGPTQIGQDNCPGSIYRYTYTVTDDCGRISAPVTRDFIIGNDGPTIECPSFNLLLECGDPNNTDYIAAHAGLVTANSSCDSDVTINYFPQNFNNVTCNTSTTVTFIATDDCGRTASCTTVVNISDNTAPEITSVYEDGICNEAVCGSDLNFWFNNWKDKVLEGLSATDACDSNVTFSTSGPNTPNQNCPDETTETVISFVANDNCGNTSSIEYSFYVTAVETPEPPQASSISGMIHTEGMEAVEDVEVYLSGGASFFEMFVTSNNGVYEFNNVPLDQNYSVTPLLDQFPMNGVSSYDLILIAQHILNMNQLDSPYKMIAADINRSGSITTLDLVELRKMILYINSDFPNNTSWRFVDANFVFPDATNPFATAFPEIVDINGLVEAIQNDFVGVKIGDVNGTAVANNLVGADDRNFGGDLVFATADQQLKAGETYEVTFRADNFTAINGYQFTLNFDQSVVDFTEVNAGDLVNMNDNNFGLALLNEGVITTSWTHNAAQSVSKEAAVFTVSFTAKADAMLSDVLSISSRYTAAEAYNNKLDLLDVNLRFDEATSVASEFRLLQNTPNPFRDETAISFVLPTASSATLTIFDVSGRAIQVITNNYEVGHNTISLNKSDLTEGVFYYKLETPNYTATKKMIMIK